MYRQYYGYADASFTYYKIVQNRTVQVAFVNSLFAK
jgi:hypothetical protein